MSPGGEKKDVLQFGKGRLDEGRDVLAICRKLSLSPSDRARRCDSDAPIESSGAQMRAELWPET